MGHHRLGAGLVGGPQWLLFYVYTGHVIWYDTTSTSSARVLMAGSRLYKAGEPRGVDHIVGEV